MHRRTEPKHNQFVYKGFYLALPLSQLPRVKSSKWLGINRKGLMSFYETDHHRLNDIQSFLAKDNLPEAYEVVLITQPRLLGYVFNPISFFMCYDARQRLFAVVAEVNNTFGESHSYLCRLHEGAPIQSHDIIEAKKLFHVSPFFNREGSYRFRFVEKENKLAIYINYIGKEQEVRLATSVSGALMPMTKNAIRGFFWWSPLMTLKVVGLIHWQALKLFVKGIAVHSKPAPATKTLSKSIKKGMNS